MHTTTFVTTEIEQLCPSLTSGVSGIDAAFTSLVSDSVVAQLLPPIFQEVAV